MFCIAGNHRALAYPFVPPASRRLRDPFLEGRTGPLTRIVQFAAGSEFGKALLESDLSEGVEVDDTHALAVRIDNPRAFQF